MLQTSSDAGAHAFQSLRYFELGEPPDDVTKPNPRDHIDDVFLIQEEEESDLDAWNLFNIQKYKNNYFNVQNYMFATCRFLYRCLFVLNWKIIFRIFFHITCQVLFNMQCIIFLLIILSVLYLLSVTVTNLCLVTKTYSVSYLIAAYVD